MILALTGYIGSGKSSVAKFLLPRGDWVRIGFADGLKDMLRAIGLTEAELYGDKKNEPSPILCGRTPRFAMQTLGHEWGRHIIDEDLWVNITKSRINYITGQNLHVVVDDLRYETEGLMLKSLGAHIWRVSRATVLGDLRHASERSVSKIPADMILHNNATLSELNVTVNSHINAMLELGRRESRGEMEAKASGEGTKTE